MTNIASERLEDTLQTYEDLCLFLEPFATDTPPSVAAEYPIRVGALANWRKLRAGLLDNTKNVFYSSDWEVTPANTPKGIMECLQTLASFPFELYRWMHESRRIFALDSKLQKFLLEGTYNDLRWGEILFPFPAFVIELEEPLVQKDKDESKPLPVIDAFMVSWINPTEEFDGYFRLRLFEKKPHQRKGVLKQSERQELEIALSRKNVRNLRRRHLKITQRSDPERYYEQGTFEIGLTIPAADNPVIEIEPRDLARLQDEADEDPDIQDGYHIYSQAIKLAVGLSLYLVHMSTNSEPGVWEPPPNTKPGPLNIITDGAYICRVVSSGTFDPSIFRPEPAIRLRTGWEMPPHHRRAFMRRPAGSPLNAKKTVRVEATFIHKDRMPPSGVAGGTRTSVLFDED